MLRSVDSKKATGLFLNKLALLSSCTFSRSLSQREYCGGRVFIPVVLTPIGSWTQCNKIKLYPGSSYLLSTFWCSCMAINLSLQYSGKFLPDIVLLTLCYYHRGIRLYAMKRFCLGSLELCSYLNVLTFFSPVWGMLRRFRCVQIFL